MTRFLIFPNQLYENIMTLRNYEKVYLLQEPIFFYDAKYRPIRPNKIKIAYMKACMDVYFETLKKNKINVQYIFYEQVDDFYTKNKNKSFEFYDVTDHTLSQKLTDYKISFKALSSPNFLLTIEECELYNKRSSKPTHASFYSFVKEKYYLLKEVPNLDYANRQKLPKDYIIRNRHDMQKTAYNKYYEDAIKWTQLHFSTHIGCAEELRRYPICSEDAYKQVDRFLNNNFEDFGKYQDAISENDVFINHAMMSPALNIGLLNPKTVLTKILKYKNKVPLNSFEGFVRQLIGWREYMRYLYVFKIKELQTNLPKNNKTFKDWDKWLHGETGIVPYDNEVKKAIKYGYSHHIVRLMIFMNLFLLCEIHPEMIKKWFMEVVSIDAYDWVMTSNIYIMGYFSNIGMRKPYISSANYILKMSNYKKNGEWEELWTSLFHRFVQKKDKSYVGFYKNNYSLSAKTDLTNKFIKNYTIIYQPLKEMKMI